MEKEQHKEPICIYFDKIFESFKIGKSSRPVDVRSKELDNTAVLQRYMQHLNRKI